MADLYSNPFDMWVVAPSAGPHMPARRARAVTPSDTLDVTNAAGDNSPCYASALYIGGTGDVSFIAAGDNSNNGAGTVQTLKAHPVGYMPVQVRRVMNTNTSATQIVGLYHR